MEIISGSDIVEYPAETTLEQIVVAIKETYRNENIGNVYQCVLKNGQQVTKHAVILEILRADKSIHHYSLHIEHIKRTKKKLQVNKSKSMALTGNSEDPYGEIAALAQFIQASIDGVIPNNEGEYRVINESGEQSIGKLIDLVKNDPAQRVMFLTELLQNLEEGPFEINNLTDALSESSERLVDSISLASRIVSYRRVLDEFRSLIEANPVEGKFQSFLGENAWLFGSEYSELLERRNWVRGHNKDFMLRRTIDGYLEIVEIKRPIKEQLFLYDESHDSYYPSAGLNKVVGQVIKYLKEMDADSHRIRSKDSEDPLKIRARIIIGRDHDAIHQEALRSYNGHLHRIEILTYDQLLRIGNRVLDVFEEKLNSPEPEFEIDDDLPF